MNRINRRDDGVIEVHMKHGVTLVDQADFERIKGMTIYANRNNRCHTLYAYVYIPNNGGRMSLHRFLMGDPKGVLVDHKNRDKLDNRRSNLRLATPRENSINGGKRRKCTSSKYKGVCFHAASGRWKAYLASRLLGHFDTEIEAAQAYDREAERRYGQYATLNFRKSPPNTSL